MILNTHLNFGGNCEEAFNFYAEHLDGRVTMMLRARDMPAGAPRPSGSTDAVIHARMDIAGVELIGNDVPPDHFKPVRSSYLYLALESAEAAERAYAALGDGGEIGIPMGATFFAARFAQLRDRFGILWSILYQRPSDEGSPSSHP